MQLRLFCQRWRAHRESYRPAGEPISPRLYEVAELAGDHEGMIVHRGHLGICYQASAAVYLGRTAPRTVRLLPDGTVLNDRAIQKIRGGEQGWRYAAGLLEKFGAEAIPCGNREDWLQCWLPKLTRRFRHTGIHKDAWALQKSARRFLPDSLPYPKFGGPDAAPVSIVRGDLDAEP